MVAKRKRIQRKQKNPGGRPPAYTDPEEVQEIVDEYFERCEEKEEFPTIAGLGLALNLTTDSLRNYGAKEEFFAIIKRAKQKVEAAWEQKLIGGHGGGPIFWLKANAGWKDKHEIEISGKDGGPIETIDYSDFTKEELETIKQAGLKLKGEKSTED